MTPISKNPSNVKIILKFLGHSEVHHLENLDIYALDNNKIIFKEHCSEDSFRYLFSITVLLFVFGKWKSYLFQDLIPRLDSDGHFYMQVGPVETTYLEDLRWALGA
jgi:hypothetical protein